MTAIEKVKEQIGMLGRYDSPDVMPFECVVSDHSYDTTKWGHLERFVFRIHTIDTQTPRAEYVEVICEITEDGIENPRDWTVNAVEPKIVTETRYIIKS